MYTTRWRTPWPPTLMHSSYFCCRTEPILEDRQGELSALQSRSIASSWFACFARGEMIPRTSRRLLARARSGGSRIGSTQPRTAGFSERQRNSKREMLQSTFYPSGSRRTCRRCNCSPRWAWASLITYTPTCIHLTTRRHSCPKDG